VSEETSEVMAPGLALNCLTDWREQVRVGIQADGVVDRAVAAVLALEAQMPDALAKAEQWGRLRELLDTTHVQLDVERGENDKLRAKLDRVLDELAVRDAEQAARRRSRELRGRVLIVAGLVAVAAVIVWWAATPSVHLPAFLTPPEGAR
jgi:hypothetical protein